MVSHRLVQVFLACLPLAAHASNINDYFNVKSGGEDVGGCDGTYGAKTGHEWLQQWFDEARQSNDAAIQSIDEYGTKLSVRENLLVFMGIKPAESQTDPEAPGKYNAVRENYRTMGTFLTTPRPEKPWIYCSGKWMQEKEWTDPVEIQNGERGSPPAKKLKKPQVPIEEVYGKEKGKNIKPYWMPDVKSYIFDTKANTVNFCDKSRSSYGATLDAQSMGEGYAGTITICMTKVTAVKGWPDTIGAKTPSAGGTVDSFLSKSGTLYHEMFHLALGSSITPDTYSGYKALIRKAAEWAQVSKWDPNDKKGNPPYLPEALVLFAEANWLTENKKSDLKDGEWWGWNGEGNAEKHPKRSRRGG